MSLIFAEKDIVYTQFGYGQILNCGNKKQIEIKQNSEEPEQSEKIEINQDKIEIEVQEQKQDENLQNLEERKNNQSEEQFNRISIQYQTDNESFKLMAYIPETEINKSIKKKITLFVKTLIGDRKKHELEIEITQNIEYVISKIFEYQKGFYNIRLIYPMGYIQNLQRNITIHQYNIPDRAQLLLLVQTVFYWDPQNKGPDIKLSNGNATANKQSPDSNYQNVFGNLCISQGRHYWEIKIDTYQDEQEILVGIAKKGLDFSQQPYNSQLFWGYLPLLAKKCAGDGKFGDYGVQCKKNDVVGVLLEFKINEGFLTFFRNGTSCGQAYSGLFGEFYPAVSLFFGEVQVTLDPKAPIPHQ